MNHLYIRVNEWVLLCYLQLQKLCEEVLAAEE